jgi:ribose transport system ATP-binding protein
LDSGEDTLLRITALSKTFGATRALENVNVTLVRRHLHGLVGENGSGKSTLIKCLTRVYKPDPGGEIRWNLGDSRSPRIAVVHQDLGLIGSLSVTDNLMLSWGFPHTRTGAVDSRTAQERAEQALSSLAPSVDPNAKVADLTLAEQALVAITRAVRVPDADVPDLVILDEPTAALPVQQRALVLDTVRQLTADGAAVVYISHHLTEVCELAQSVIVLRGGRLIEQLRAPIEQAQVVHLMSGASTFASVRDSASDTVTADSAELAFAADGVTTQTLRDVSLGIRSGEIVGVTGLLGSGVSELCRALAGSAEFVAGQLRIHGHEVRRINVPSLLRAGVVFVPGARKREGGVLSLSLADNLNLMHLQRRFLLGPVRQRALDAHADQLMDEHDVRPRNRKLPFAAASGGNQQKVVIARCLDADPTLLILENPTQGVDPLARQHIRKSLLTAASRGVAVLIADVDPDEVLAVSHRVYVVADGRIAAEVDTRDLSAADKVRSAAYR